MLNRSYLSIISLVCLTLLSGCLHDITYEDMTDTKVVEDKLYVSGTLNAQTYDELSQIIETNPQLTTLVLEDIDGSIDDEINLQTALMVHQAGLNTYLPSNGFIESGAVDLFCAGHQRFAERGAHVGVHSWGDDEQNTSGDEFDRNSEEHQMYVDYFEQVGCPVSFYWFTIDAAPADDIYVMTDKELIEQGVVTEFVK